VETSYNTASVAITLYYAFWVGVAIIVFWPLYRMWTSFAGWETFDNRLASLLVWSLAFGGSIAFATYILPALPQVIWTESWNPPEFIEATPWYFLPKSIDILFQQLLIVALVISLSAQGFGLRNVTLYCAALFGGVHILLFFGDVPILYVVRFMASAAVFGLVFPYLILRVRNGLAYSYIVHWLYYAVSVMLPHIFLSSVR
jgi:hypothetical protein